VTFDFGTASTADDLTLTPGTKRFGGSGKIAFADFIEVSASFGFEETTTTVNGVATTRILWPPQISRRFSAAVAAPATNWGFGCPMAKSAQ
jgi:hypothetical protein